MKNQPGKAVDGVELPGYAISGSAFRLRADASEFTPESMERTGPGSFRRGEVEIRLIGSKTPDGSEAVWLEATGVSHVEEVCLLDHTVAPAPSEIHNHRWFNWFDMQQSTVVFLRDEAGGAFASWANPFGRVESSADHLRLWYRPAMDIDNGHFVSDPLVTGSWQREGRELRFEARPDRDGPVDREPAYINLLAAERPVVLDSGEARAVRRAVASRAPWLPARARSSHWEWGENLYRRDPAEQEARDIYERLFELSAELGIEVVLLEPGSNNETPSTEGPWQHVMWLGMGTDLGHGDWRPNGSSAEQAEIEPDGVRELLAMARKHGIGIAAYVNPQFPWLLDENWRLLPPSDAPDAYGHAPVGCMAVPEARDWLIATLRAFIAEYDLAGISLDFVMWNQCHATNHPHEPGADSVYAQWDGYRRILAALREDPEAWVECLIGGPNLMPWGAGEMTHPCPFIWDNQPQWVPAWPDLSLDRAYGNFGRRSGWWYRSLAMLPSYKVPGPAGHQANRLRDLPVERGWDWSGARFNLLSAIATGPSSLSFSFLPCWDEAEWSGMRQRDGAFFRRWMDFARDNAAVLSRLEDLYDEPRPGAVDGTMALSDEDCGFVFLANPDFIELSCEVPLPEDRLLRELYPEEGRYWGASVTVEPHQVHVLEVISENELARPVLLGALGTASASGEVLTATGRPGSNAEVQALLADGSSVSSTVVFADDGVFSSLGPWRSDGQPVALSELEQSVRMSTKWAPSPLLPGFLRELAPPVEPIGHERLQPWSDPSRLRLFVELTEPRDATVRISVDGELVEVSTAYMGTWADVTDVEEFRVDRNMLGHYIDLTDRLGATEDLERAWDIEIEIEGFAKGSLRGVHVAHLPRRTTKEFTVVDLLGLEWLKDLAKAPSEAAFVPNGSTGELLRLHAWQSDPPGAVFERELVYGEANGKPLTLLAYRRADRSERRPAVVFVHGGGWAAGDPSFHTAHSHLLATHGYVAVNIEYRLHPNARWPDSLEDVKCAVRWVRAHADELGVDPARIGIAGGSAGGHLAAMAALTPGRFEGTGGWQDQSSAVQAAVLWYPAADLPAMAPAIAGLPKELSRELTEIVTQYFGAHAAEASPINQIQADCPPILSMTGDADVITQVAMVAAFHAALDEAGVVNRLEVTEGGIHGFDLYSSTWNVSAERMLEFFDEHLGAAAPDVGRGRA